MSDQNGNAPACPICGKPSQGYCFAMAVNAQPETCSKECVRALAQVLLMSDVAKLLGQLVAQGAPKVELKANGKPVDLADLTRRA